MLLVLVFATFGRLDAPVTQARELALVLGGVVEAKPRVALGGGGHQRAARREDVAKQMVLRETVRGAAEWRGQWVERMEV